VYRLFSHWIILLLTALLTSVKSASLGVAMKSLSIFRVKEWARRLIRAIVTTSTDHS
jgi:hypothetical protein